MGSDNDDFEGLEHALEGYHRERKELRKLARYRHDRIVEAFQILLDQLRAIHAEEGAEVLRHLLHSHIYTLREIHDLYQTAADVIHRQSRKIMGELHTEKVSSLSAILDLVDDKARLFELRLAEKRPGENISVAAMALHFVAHDLSELRWGGTPIDSAIAGPSILLGSSFLWP